LFSTAAQPGAELVAQVKAEAHTRGWRCAHFDGTFVFFLGERTVKMTEADFASDLEGSFALVLVLFRET
jgi:hypothetical protein